jgi:hypothetical protein
MANLKCVTETFFKFINDQYDPVFLWDICPSSSHKHLSPLHQFSHFLKRHLLSPNEPWCNRFYDSDTDLVECFGLKVVYLRRCSYLGLESIFLVICKLYIGLVTTALLQYNRQLYRVHFKVCRAQKQVLEFLLLLKL